MVPNPPINLADTVAVTTAYVIGFTWEDATLDGGSQILDWRINWDQSTQTYEILEAGITERSYQTKVSLVPGATYRFKVEARNSVGYSLLSEELVILCAQPPD